MYAKPTTPAPARIVVTAELKVGGMFTDHAEGIIVATGLVGGFNPQPDPPGRP